MNVPMPVTLEWFPLAVIIGGMLLAVIIAAVGNNIIERVCPYLERGKHAVREVEFESTLNRNDDYLTVIVNVRLARDGDQWKIVKHLTVTDREGEIVPIVFNERRAFITEALHRI